MSPFLVEEHYDVDISPNVAEIIDKWEDEDHYEDTPIDCWGLEGDDYDAD